MDTMHVNFKNKITKGHPKNQVATNLGISRPTLDKLVAENNIQTPRKGKSRLILEHDYLRLKEIINGYNEVALTTTEDVNVNYCVSNNEILEENTKVALKEASEDIVNVNVKNDVKPETTPAEIELLKRENEKLGQEVEYFKTQLENVKTEYKEELSVKNVLLKDREETFKQTIANFEKIIANKEALMLNLNNKLLYLEQNVIGRNEELEKLKTEKDVKIQALMSEIAIKDNELSSTKLTIEQILEIESEKEILQGRVNTLEKEKKDLINNLELGILEKDKKIDTLTKNIEALEEVKSEKEKLEKELEELRNKGLLSKLKKIFGRKYQESI